MKANAIQTEISSPKVQCSTNDDSQWDGPALAFFASIFLHLILDTIVGGIMWGAPFDEALRTVPAGKATAATAAQKARTCTQYR